MPFPYTWVRSLEDSVWSESPPRKSARGEVVPPRYFVRVLVERAMWQVDRQPVEVVQGLVVGFANEDQAKYFLTAHDPRFEAPRCEPVHVVPGMDVAFWEQSDALSFVSAGRAEITTEAEVAARYHAAQGAGDGSDASGMIGAPSAGNADAGADDGSNADSDDASSDDAADASGQASAPKASSKGRSGRGKK